MTIDSHSKPAGTGWTIVAETGDEETKEKAHSPTPSLLRRWWGKVLVLVVVVVDGNGLYSEREKVQEIHVLILISAGVQSWIKRVERQRIWDFANL